MNSITSSAGDRVGRPRPVVRLARVWAGLLGLWLLAAPLAAQNRLYVLESGNKYRPVYRVTDGRPYIMEQGKLVAAAGQRYALIKVDEFLPVFVAVKDRQAMITALSSTDGSGMVQNGFHFSADFEAADALDDVFLVLEAEFSNVGKSVFVYEIGHLDPRTVKPFSVDLPMERNLRLVQFELHLFVGGTEVFQSEQPAGFREQALDRMIARRIASVQQAEPRPFYGSAPEYPPALRKVGGKGEAVVTMRVTPKGAVVDPVVERASDPAFGEAALAAARDWRFLPRVADGRPVEARVSLPIAFDPP